MNILTLGLFPYFAVIGAVIIIPANRTDSTKALCLGSKERQLDSTSSRFKKLFDFIDPNNTISKDDIYNSFRFASRREKLRLKREDSQPERIQGITIIKKEDNLTVQVLNSTDDYRSNNTSEPFSEESIFCRCNTLNCEYDTKVLQEDNNGERCASRGQPCYKRLIFRHHETFELYGCTIDQQIHPDGICNHTDWKRKEFIHDAIECCDSESYCNSKILPVPKLVIVIFHELWQYYVAVFLVIAFYFYCKSLYYRCARNQAAKENYYTSLKRTETV